MPGIRRIAQHHHDRRVLLGVGGVARFLDQPFSKQREMGQFPGLLQRIGQIDPQAIIAGKVVARFPQQQTEFQMGDRIRRHQQLEAIQTRQQMLAHIARP